MALKRIVILGSTGSIGVNTLKVVDRFPDKFKVVGLTAYNNFKLLEKQVKKYKPEYIAVSPKGLKYFKSKVNKKKVRLLDVGQDLPELVALPVVDVVVIGISGSAALIPFLSAVRAGKTIAPANKEALVIAGDMIMKEAARNGAKIIPVDSEQSAIFQCLAGQNKFELEKVFLTASGGAIYNVPKSKFGKLTKKQILSHPRWKMGQKITVDSATLMNKGFEVIEAVRLFNLDVKQIEVLIHPEAIVHSMVGFKDGSIIAQLGVTDMQIPIQYALTYPNRLDSGLKLVDFSKLEKLTFGKPDTNKFPALDLAFYGIKKGGTLPCVLNAADEEAVDAFLKEKLLFSKIIHIVEKVVEKHRVIGSPNLKQLIDADAWAREETKKLICK